MLRRACQEEVKASRTLREAAEAQETEDSTAADVRVEAGLVHSHS